jgi:hypothetical protein
MLNYLARIILPGIILELLWLQIWKMSPLRSHTYAFIALMLGIFVISLAAFLIAPLNDRKSVLWMLAFALAFRLTVLPAMPGQSEDVYRYLWDAKISSLGINPYQYPPDAPELAPFRDQQIYPMLNSRPYVTAYPPLSQALFRLSYAGFGPSVLAMKSLFSLLEFLSVLLAWRLLVAWKAPLRPLFLMAWNPFFIFEFSHSGHSDSSMMFLALLAIFLLHRSACFLGMTSIAGAILSKLHPVLWLPVLWRRVHGAGIAICLAVTGAGIFAFIPPANIARYLKSLGLYFRLFEFNAGIHYFLRYLGKVAVHQSWDKTTGPYLAGVLVLIALGIARYFPTRNAKDLLHACFWIMVADLCLATTVHPWYLSWAALALPAFPYAFMAYWTGACFLSYIAYSSQPVFEPTWVLLVEYLPMYALMIWEIRRGKPLLERS